MKCCDKKDEHSEKRRKVEYFENRKRKSIERAKSDDDDRISLSSSQSLSYSTHKKSKQTSSTTVTLEYKDVSFKDEPPPQLFGYFFCEVIILSPC